MFALRVQRLSCAQARLLTASEVATVHRGTIYFFPCGIRVIFAEQKLEV